MKGLNYFRRGLCTHRVMEYTKRLPEKKKNSFILLEFLRGRELTQAGEIESNRRLTLYKMMNHFQRKLQTFDNDSVALLVLYLNSHYSMKWDAINAGFLGAYL